MRLANAGIRLKINKFLRMEVFSMPVVKLEMIDKKYGQVKCNHDKINK